MADAPLAPGWTGNFLFGLNSPQAGGGAATSPFLTQPISGAVQGQSGHRNPVSTPQSHQAQQQTATANALRNTGSGLGSMNMWQDQLTRPSGTQTQQQTQTRQEEAPVEYNEWGLPVRMYTSRTYNPSTGQVVTNTRDLNAYDNWSDLRQWFWDNGYGYIGGPILRGNGQIYTNKGWWDQDENGMPTGDPYGPQPGGGWSGG